MKYKPNDEVKYLDHFPPYKWIRGTIRAVGIDSNNKPYVDIKLHNRNCGVITIHLERVKLKGKQVRIK